MPIKQRLGRVDKLLIYLSLLQLVRYAVAIAAI